MRTFSRIFLVVVGAASFFLIVYLLFWKPEKSEYLSAVAGALAVLAAGVAAWPTIRAQEIQEDASRPAVTVFFDSDSEPGVLLLKVKNLGAGIAYKIKLKWDEHPTDELGDPGIWGMDEYPMLLPQQSYSTRIAAIVSLVKLKAKLDWAGTIEYADATGDTRTELFTCESVDFSALSRGCDPPEPTTVALHQIAASLDSIRAELVELKRMQFRPTTARQTEGETPQPIETIDSPVADRSDS